MNANIDVLIAAVAKMTKTAKFASILYTSKQNGEVARHTIILNSNYIKTLEASILEAEIQLPSLSGIDRDACNAVLESLRKSLDAHLSGQQSSDYTKKGQCLPIAEAPSIKVSLNDGSLEISGLSHSKVVIQEGEPRKPVNSSPLTLAKNRIRNMLPISKFRTFAIENAKIAKLNGETIEFE
jgi:hypothetical protein